MSPEETATNLTNSKESSLNTILFNAAVMTEVGMDLKDRFLSGEKYVSYLKTIVCEADKAITSLHDISKNSLEQAQKLLIAIKGNDVSPVVKRERDRLFTLIEKHLCDLELHLDNNLENMDISRITEKIR